MNHLSQSCTLTLSWVQSLLFKGEILESLFLPSCHDKPGKKASSQHITVLEVQTCHVLLLGGVSPTQSGSCG